MPKKYQVVTKKIKTLCRYSFDDKLEHIIEWLQSIKEDYPDYYDFHISLESGWGDEPDQFLLFGNRLENDSERNKRLAKARKIREDKKAAKILKEEQEREEYERLKAKFGK